MCLLITTAIAVGETGAVIGSTTQTVDEICIQCCMHQKESMAEAATARRTKEIREIHEITVTVALLGACS